MWYLVEMLFAEPPEPGRTDYQCEACNVVLQAGNALEAHRKAIEWGTAYAADPPTGMQLLGVSHLTTVGEELGDGTEICGRFFQVPAPWERLRELVPPLAELEAVRWEESQGVPLRELLSPAQVAQLKRLRAQDA